MNFYKADLIKKGIKISQYLADQGVKMQGNRAVASWRNGDRYSVSIDDEKGVWHDFVSEEGGDIIALFTRIEGGDFLSACRTLGDRYGLIPYKVSKKPPKVTRGEMLIKDGYALIKTYEYQNADGTSRYFVDRYEKIDGYGNKYKEFVQRGPNADNLHGIERTLYKLPLIASALVVHVCEGEKDADTLVRLGLTATTNSGGAKFWQADFGKLFEGKDVVVHLDNDDAGQARKDIIVTNIAQFAKSVKVLTISKLPKGDVTDFFEREGGSLSDFIEAVEAAPIVNACPKEIADAKAANSEPLRNYIEVEGTTPTGRPTMRKVARGIAEICDDISTRFLGFPKVLGTQLFDYATNAQTNEREILPFNDENDLHAWIDGVSKHQSDFNSGSSFATYKTVAKRLLQTRPKYDVVAVAPWYPARRDAFSAFDKLPSPDLAHSKFNELMRFFSPATDADATLIRAFFIAPIFYNGCERPAWIIDAVDGQGTGKSKIVEKCCRLYKENPLQFGIDTIRDDETKLKRELLSAEGRKKRIVMIDNVTTSFKCEPLSKNITIHEISGMRPYGKGVEIRKNDITWVATSNGAVLDTDAAVRYYVIQLKAPAKRDPLWEKTVDAFIDENRNEILAEIIDMLQRAPVRTRKVSRFGEYDSIVLSAACETDAQFEAADAKIAEASEAANDDADLAAQFVEAMIDALFGTRDLSQINAKKGELNPRIPIAIRCTDVDDILRRTNGAIRNWTSKAVRRHVNSGVIKNIVKGVERLWTSEAKAKFGTSRLFIFSPDATLLRDMKRCQFVEFKGQSMSVLGVADV